MPAPKRTIVFTAFEPSGDALAAAVIAALRRADPSLRIAAWGGPNMRAAGADIIEETVHGAQMGLPGAGKILEHLRLNARAGRWLAAHRPSLHVPVDSPAANFPICARSKALGISVVHLAAPQVWAWAQHRVNKLRRLTDLVLCLLPFEAPWFIARGVPAAFIGHPMFDTPLDRAALAQAAALFPTPSGQGKRIALLPGSRVKEIRNNFPVMLRALAAVRQRWPGSVAVVAPANESDEALARAVAAERGGWPPHARVALRGVDAAASWADVVLTVSGTVTLQVARAGAPMVILYRIKPVPYHAIGRWIIRSESATLPNLIAGRRIVPEFVPFTGRGAPLVAALVDLLGSPGAREAQREGLRGEVAARFEASKAAEAAAAAILGKMDSPIASG